MDAVIALVVIVDIIMALKMFFAMKRANFNKEVYLDGTWWARVGFLMMFHLVVGLLCAIAYILNLLVHASL